MPAASTARRQSIRNLNDGFRWWPKPNSDQWLLTRGVFDLGPEFVALAIEQVRTFDMFDADNDPYGEHDFGSFNLAGQHLFWKIDYYDRTRCAGSPNPADPFCTVRVMTIMLASEY